jgi:tRNA threonylcarbamoyladenosine biosynthesis protein TsaE
MRIAVSDESEMVTLACRLAAALPESGFVMTLSGELGAGKTTLIRAVLRTLGVAGPIRSPTYTLVEPYDLPGRRAWHLDLYRIGDPGELEFLGVRDFDPANDLIFIEWPERGGDMTPDADLAIDIAAMADRARQIQCQAPGERGKRVITALQ